MIKSITMILIYLILIFTSTLSFGIGTVQLIGNTAGNVAQNAATDSAKESFFKNSGLKKFGDYMSTPTGIMIVSGIAGANAFTLKQAAADQASECDSNIAKIDLLLKSFKDSWTGLCPNGREDLNVPDCYCYLDAGGPNPNRTNSETCQKLWAQNNYKLTASASDYKTNLATVDPVGCIAADGTFDQNCSCKRIVDTSGNNTCKKITNFNVPTNSIGAAYVQSSGTANLINAVNQLSQGNIGLSNLNGRSLALGFAKQVALNNSITKQLFDKSPAGSFKGVNNDKDLLKLQNGILPPKLLDSYAKAFGGSAQTSISATPPAELTKAIKDVTKKTGLELSGSGGGLNSKKAQPNNGINLNFGDAQAQNNAQSNVDFGNKNYKMNKNSDINKENGASIFEIISNRYIQSGVNRLFEEPK